MTYTFKQHMNENESTLDTNPKAPYIEIVVANGIRKMQRMMYLSPEIIPDFQNDSKNPEDQSRQRRAGRIIDKHIDDFDMLEALDMIEHYFEETESMMNKPMRRAEDSKGKALPKSQQPTTFDFIRDVKEALKSYYVDNNSDEMKRRLNERKYKHLFDQVLLPIVDMFKDYSHQDALFNIGHVIKSAKDYIIHSDILSSADDATVAKAQIASTVRRRRNKHRIRKDAEAIMKLRNKSQRSK